MMRATSKSLSWFFGPKAPSCQMSKIGQQKRFGRFTVDPRPVDNKNVKSNFLEKFIFKMMYKEQKIYEEQLLETGLTNSNAFTCACYLPEVGNIPNYGDILAWSESSAVVYANSVLGARCNRNSAGIDVLCGVLNKVPEFGLLTDEGRKAKWRIEVKTSDTPDAQLLGSAIGLKVMEDVPLIVGLDQFLGKELNGSVKDYLKDMGAACASNGAVGLYHVLNLTPEAVEQGEKILLDDYQTYVIDDAELIRIMYSYPNIWKKPNSKPKKCFIGCPHLSLQQLHSWTEKIEAKLTKDNQKKVKTETILCSAPDVVDKFMQERTSYEKLTQMGVKITSICPLMYMSNPLCKKKPVVTNSNKLRTYSTARFFLENEILDILSNGSMADVKGGKTK